MFCEVCGALGVLFHMFDSWACLLSSTITTKRKLVAIIVFACLIALKIEIFRITGLFQQKKCY